MNRYALYARVSTEGQKTDGTIRMQLDAARAWEASGRKISARYLDDGVSAQVPFADRPESKRLLRDARAGKLSHVVVYDYKRLGRDQLDTLQAIKTLNSLGVRVVSILEPVPQGDDADDDAASFMVGVLTSFGQYDWSSLRRKLKDGRDRAVREGRYAGGRIPFGYRVEAGRLAPDPAESPVLCRVFEMYDSPGSSLKLVAARLNAEGVPTPAAWREGAATVWTPDKIHKILTNPVYAGRSVWRKTRKVTEEGETVWRRGNDPTRQLVAEVAPLVSPEAFARVQSLLRERVVNSPRNSHRDYLLRSLVKCAVCGLSYVGQSRTRGGGRECWYRCGSRYRPAGACGNGMVRAEWLEEDVWAKVVEMIGRPAGVVGELRAQMESEAARAPDPGEEVARLDALISERGRARARLMRAFINTDADDPEALRLLSELDSERTALEAERERAASSASRTAERARAVAGYERLLRSLLRKSRAADAATRREVLRAVVGSVSVEKPDRFTPARVTIRPRVFG